MVNNDYHVIKSTADVKELQAVSNGLHDGYILHVEYCNNGISACNHHLSFDYSKKALRLHILVTSLPEHPTFEIFFQNILEWQVNEYQFSNMIGFSVLFLDNGMIMWADGISSNMDDLKSGSYVIADTIQYRQLS